MIFDVKLPSSWSQLSQKQLRIVYSYLSSDVLSTFQCKLLLAFKFGGIKFYGMHKNDALVRVNGVLMYLDAEETLSLAHSLDFIDEDPEFPIRLYELKGRKAVHPLLRELSFAKWLAMENLYFGFLETRDVSLLNEVLTFLYPKSGTFIRFIKTFNSRKLNYCHINAIQWLKSFKRFLTRRYPEIYKNIRQNDASVAPAMSQQSMIESMNAQIRALTKGDITKKEAVLSMDLHSALTELNALALEARKLNESLKKK